MGQYFKPSFETQSGEKFIIDRRGCKKFTEWSFLENTDMMVIAQLIKESTAQGDTIKYFHVGDYSELFEGRYDADVNKALTDAFQSKYDSIEEFAEGEDRDNPDDIEYQALKAEQETYYLYNHTKREMLSIKGFIEAGHNVEPNEYNSNDSWALHPLALLCCSEQCRGGGDYYYYCEGEKLENGGRWAGDDISISDEVKVGFTDISGNLRLTATKEDFEEIVTSPTLDEMKKAFSKF